MKLLLLVTLMLLPSLSALAENLPLGKGFLYPVGLDLDDENAYAKLQTMEVLTGSKAKFAGNRAHYTELAVIECQYELNCVVVHSTKTAAGKLQLEIKNKAGESLWVSLVPPYKYQPYDEFLKDALMSLRGSAASLIRRDPGGQAAPSWLGTRLDDLNDDDNNAVEWLGAKRVGSNIWLHLKFSQGRICSRGELVRLGKGWLPLFTPKGESSILFYARGC